jgi:flagellar hook-length control protein FliK
LPVTGDSRAAPPATDTGADAGVADSTAGSGFGRALGDAIKDLDQLLVSSRATAEERKPASADSLLSAAGIALDPAPSPATVAGAEALIAAPAQLAVSADARWLEAGAPAANGVAGAVPAPPAAGNILPLVDEALPRGVPAAPATAPGGARDALVRPHAATADIALAPPRDAETPPPVASTRPGGNAERPSSVHRVDTGTLHAASAAGSGKGLAPGLVEVAPLRAPDAAMQAPAGRAGDSAGPLPPTGIARALERVVVVGTDATGTTDAGAIEAATPSGTATGARPGGSDAGAPPTNEAAASPLHTAAGRSSPERMVFSATAPVVPVPAARPAEREPPAHHAVARGQAEGVPGVAVPVAGAVAVVPPVRFAASVDAATDSPAASGALPRHRPHASAPQGEAQGVPAAAQPNARVTDTAAAPWLQALAQARELAVDPVAAPLDSSAAGAPTSAVGERTGTAGPALQALAAWGARPDGAAGAGALAAPLAVGQAGAQWAGELEARVQWLAGRNLRSAEIQLDPPELGPLQVQVQSHRDGTSVHFTTQSAAVRELVEASLPRLREMLESGGMNLVDVNVAQQQGGRGEREPLAGVPGIAGVRGEEDVPGASTALVIGSRGLVDAYA